MLEGTDHWAVKWSSQVERSGEERMIKKRSCRFEVEGKRLREDQERDGEVSDFEEALGSQGLRLQEDEKCVCVTEEDGVTVVHKGMTLHLKHL